MAAHEDERRRDAVSAARRDGHSLKEIAQAIGTTSTNLSTLLSRGSQYSPYVPALDTWLREHGYWPEKQAKTKRLSVARLTTPLPPGSSSPTVDEYLRLLAAAHDSADEAAMDTVVNIGVALARILDELGTLRLEIARVQADLVRK